MTRFEDEYLPLARSILDMQDTIDRGADRILEVRGDDSPEARAERTAYDNYLGQIAYGNAYRAFMQDEGGQQQTTAAIESMEQELAELEAILRGEE